MKFHSYFIVIFETVVVSKLYSSSVIRSGAASIASMACLNRSYRSSDLYILVSSVVYHELMAETECICSPSVHRLFTTSDQKR